MHAKYLIAQYLPNKLRREPRNVGVILISGDQCCARFLGQTSNGDGAIDLRTCSWAAYPQIYKRWVEFWQEEVGRGSVGLAKRLATGHGNYGVVEGGSYCVQGQFPVETLCEQLFSSIVAPPAEVKIAPETDVRNSQLTKDVKAELKNLGIFGGTAGKSVKHPVLAHKWISGKITAHQIACNQTGPRGSAIEIVEFSGKRIKASAWHAGWAASAFQDIKLASAKNRCIALVRIAGECRDDRQVESSLKMLTANADQVVNWEDKKTRSAFLEERREAAFAVSG